MGTTTAPPVERLALSIPDAMVASGLGRSTLYLLMDDGTLPYVKVRGRRLITVTALRMLLSDTDVTPTPRRRTGHAGSAG